MVRAVKAVSARKNKRSIGSFQVIVPELESDYARMFWSNTPNVEGSTSKNSTPSDNRMKNFGGMLAFAVCVNIIVLMYFLCLHRGESAEQKVPSCAMPVCGRGDVVTPGVRVVAGEHVLVDGDQLLFCEPGAIVHLGNATTIPDGMRVIIRPLDGEARHTYGWNPKYEVVNPPRARCKQAGCQIFAKNWVTPALGVEVRAPAEMIFIAQWNAWYEL